MYAPYTKRALPKMPNMCVRNHLVDLLNPKSSMFKSSKNSRCKSPKIADDVRIEDIPI